jgi:hypothetical protein
MIPLGLSGSLKISLPVAPISRMPLHAMPEISARGNRSEWLCRCHLRILHNFPSLSTIHRNHHHLRLNHWQRSTSEFDLCFPQLKQIHFSIITYQLLLLTARRWVTVHHPSPPGTSPPPSPLPPVHNVCMDLQISLPLTLQRRLNGMYANTFILHNFHHRQPSTTTLKSAAFDL